MKKLLSITIIAVALTTASAFAQTSAKPAAAKTLTGVVSDSMCGAKHMAKDKSAADCTRECVKSSSDYALVAGSKVYVLKALRANISETLPVVVINEQGEEEKNKDEQEFSWCCLRGRGWRGTKRRRA